MRVASAGRDRRSRVRRARTRGRVGGFDAFQRARVAVSRRAAIAQRIARGVAVVRVGADERVGRRRLVGVGE